MWIQGFLPEKLNKKITEQCHKNNKELKLSERFLIYPLHISLKRTFVYADFEKTKEIENQYKQWDYQLYTMQESGCLILEGKELNEKNIDMN